MWMRNGEPTQQLESAFQIHDYGVPGSLSPIDKSLWSHPMLAFYQEPKISMKPKVPAKLYLVPTPEYFGRDVEDYSDPEFLAKPSPLSELPEIQEWVTKFALGVVEIWGGRRSANQLSRWCHRQVHQQLLNKPTAINAINTGFAIFASASCNILNSSFIYYIVKQNKYIELE